MHNEHDEYNNNNKCPEKENNYSLNTELRTPVRNEQLDRKNEMNLEIFNSPLYFLPSHII